MIGSRRFGTLTALDSRTNKIVWQKTMLYAISAGSGSLATAGGLLFHGEPDGNMQAYDAQTGDLLWQFQTGFGADGAIVSYEIDGEQYVAIPTGGTSLAQSARGDAVWAFKLKGKLGRCTRRQLRRPMCWRRRRAACPSQRTPSTLVGS